MAYLDQNHSHKRLAGVTGVALVHIVLAVGLVAGLTIEEYVRPAPPPPIGGEQIPLPPPPVPTDTPTPTPTQTQAPRDSTETAPPVPFPRPTGETVPPTPADPPTGTPYTGGIDLTGPTVPPDPPIPTFPPRPPVPANGPRGWVTNDDYPRIAIQREWEGTVGYAVEVSAAGRVTACSITSSSGREVLDDTACRRIQQRARFRPATDRTGAEVAGTYRGSVSWQIPD